MIKQLHLAALIVVMGCLLLIASFIAPPLGVIDPTILTAFGEALTFAGALCGVDYHYKSKYGNREEEN